MVLFSRQVGCPHLEHEHGPVVKRLKYPHLEQGHGPVIPGMSSLREGTWSCGPWNVLRWSRDKVLLSRYLDWPHLEQGYGLVVPEMSSLRAGTWSCCLDAWDVTTKSRDMVLLSLECPHL